MQHLKVGHFTNSEKGTGVSVFLFDEPAKGSYILCGGAPATHDINTLDLTAIVPTVNGLVFTGGSAFGLSAIAGVMRWHQEQGRGFPTPAAPIPIVPGAGIYDLHFKKPQPPSSEEAYQACVFAHENNKASGQIGAGTGATVGKLIPNARMMNGGMGFAEIILPNGIQVWVYAVVNSLGDVRNENGAIIAGARTQQNQFVDSEKYILAGHREETMLGSNTTLVAVFTDADFNKMELHRIARMGIAGIARAISPIFSRYDGDILFCFSLGQKEASETTVGTMAAEAVRLAIVNAVMDSEII